MLCLRLVEHERSFYIKPLKLFDKSDVIQARFLDDIAGYDMRNRKSIELKWCHTEFPRPSSSCSSLDPGTRAGGSTSKPISAFDLPTGYG